MVFLIFSIGVLHSAQFFVIIECSHDCRVPPALTIQILLCRQDFQQVDSISLYHSLYSNLAARGVDMRKFVSQFWFHHALEALSVSHQVPSFR